MAIVRMTIDDIFDLPPMTAAEIKALEEAEDLYDPDCLPLTAEQLRHAVPLRVANPAMYAEIEAARERALARKAEREKQERETNAVRGALSAPQEERGVCNAPVCFA